jgi:uncharacterized protein
MSSRASKSFDARHLDVARFATEQGVLREATTLAEFRRLSSEVVAQAITAATPVVIEWEAQGQMRRDAGLADGVARPALWLRAQTRLPLTCQRCLQPVWVAVEVSRYFLFAPDEEQAAQLDEHAQDDVLALSPSFDLHGLVEDELLLALPLVPRHEVCSQTLPQSAQDADFDAAGAQQPHPFAALAALKPANIPKSPPNGPKGKAGDIDL